MKKEIGLVFGGGGGKGSYQVGVWKGLRVLGIDRYIGAVSGTSIGALNGAMFCTGDYEQAYNAWKSVSEESVLIKNEIKKSKNYTYESWFSNAGVESFIDSYINFDEIPNGIDCYVTASRIDYASVYDRMKRYSQKDYLYKAASILLMKLLWFQSKAITFHINDYETDEIKDILLASSAIPLIFPDINIKDKSYVDGGIKNNIPIMPLYERGYRKIIVVTMDDKVKIDRWKYRNAEIILLNINEPNMIANLIGTLDFRAESVMKRMEKGYKDCMQKREKIRKLVE